jgi:MFS family permease
MTGSNEKLALISTCSMLPVLFLGPLAGSIVDLFDKKKLLVLTQIYFACSAGFLAISTALKIVRLEFLIVIALLNGLVACVEMPVRQATMSATVPKEDLAAAIPFNGLTFNLARVIGPSIGGILLAKFGVQACYLTNTFTYSALIFAASVVHTDLAAKTSRTEPILDLIQEGFLYTWREPRLKMLFLLEIGISLFSLFYLAQLPAYAKEFLNLGKVGLGQIYTAVGLGAISALFLTSKTADIHIKGFLIRGAVTLMGLCLGLLSITNNIFIAFPLFVLLGMSGVVIFNTCNALFQLLAPERLRGRVLSMHIWALNGVGPIGTYSYGLLAESRGLGVSLQIASILTLALATWAWLKKLKLESQ